MGRKKQPYRQTRRQESLERAAVIKNQLEREEEFYDIAADNDWDVPWILKNWKSHFRNKENFLEEAEEWIKNKFLGVKHPLISISGYGYERNHNRPPNEDAKNENMFGWPDEDDYWSCHQYPMRRKGVTWHNPKLPLTPKIPSPTGLQAEAPMVM